MKRIIKSIVNSLTCLIKSLLFCYFRIREKYLYGHYEFSYSAQNKGKRIHVLCTGPSLRQDLPELMGDKQFMKEDKICVNYFFHDEVIRELKPTIYCLADPVLFEATHIGIFNDINAFVDWDMKLVIPLYGREIVRTVKSMLTNNHITLVAISALLYNGFEKNRYKSWETGRSVPSYVNISIMASYVALNMGYSDIYLYGVEHTFFENMGVDDENRLYLTDSHFYGSEKRYVLRNGQQWHIKDWLYDKYLTFLEHERMRGYADYLGSTIVNCTENSLIDSYVRLSQIKKT